MFIKKLEFGIPGNPKTVVDPTWTFVHSCICSIDGVRRIDTPVNDGVVLQLEGHSYMGISGGLNGQFIVAGYFEGYGSFICANGPTAGPVQNVSVNGDLNPYQSKFVVDLDVAVCAAKTFCEHGRLTESLTWERWQ
jgi:hypothetical protein